MLFYHSGCAVHGIAGLAEVASTPYPDDTQFDPSSKYLDPKVKREEPLAEMPILQRDNRLSITPVSAAEWRHITNRLMKS